MLECRQSPGGILIPMSHLTTHTPAPKTYSRKAVSRLPGWKASSPRHGSASRLWLICSALFVFSIGLNQARAQENTKRTEAPLELLHKLQASLAELHVSPNESHDEFHKRLDNAENAAKALADQIRNQGETDLLAKANEVLTEVGQLRLAWLGTKTVQAEQISKIVAEAKSLEKTLLQSSIENGTIIDTLIDLGKVLISWPLVTLIMFIVLTRSNKFQKNIFGRLNALKLGAGSVEIKLSESNATDVKITIQDLFTNYRKQIDALFAKKVNQLSIPESLQNLFEHEVKPLLDPDIIPNVRCTVHVEDVLINDSLYQLLDYFPKGKGAGRVKSTRYGLIGLVWRHRRDYIQARVSVDPDELVRQWGMSREEALQAVERSARKSFAGFLLKSSKGHIVGIFYMDHPDQCAFGDPESEDSKKVQQSKDLKSNLINSQHAKNLADDIDETLKELKKIGIQLSIHH